MYGKLNEESKWCPDWKSLGTALFFEAPKNYQGFFYYEPLKIAGPRTGFQTAPARPQEGLARGMA